MVESITLLKASSEQSATKNVQTFSQKKEKEKTHTSAKRKFLRTEKAAILSGFYLCKQLDNVFTKVLRLRTTKNSHRSKLSGRAN